LWEVARERPLEPSPPLMSSPLSSPVPGIEADLAADEEVGDTAEEAAAGRASNSETSHPCGPARASTAGESETRGRAEPGGRPTRTCTAPPPSAVTQPWSAPAPCARAKASMLFLFWNGGREGGKFFVESPLMTRKRKIYNSFSLSRLRVFRRPSACPRRRVPGQRAGRRGRAVAVGDVAVVEGEAGGVEKRARVFFTRVSF